MNSPDVLCCIVLISFSQLHKASWSSSLSTKATHGKHTFLDNNQASLHAFSLNGASSPSCQHFQVQSYRFASFILIAKSSVFILIILGWGRRLKARVWWEPSATTFNTSETPAHWRDILRLLNSPDVKCCIILMSFSQLQKASRFFFFSAKAIHDKHTFLDSNQTSLHTLSLNGAPLPVCQHF